MKDAVKLLRGCGVRVVRVVRAVRAGSRSGSRSHVLKQAASPVLSVPVFGQPRSWTFHHTGLCWLHACVAVAEIFFKGHRLYSKNIVFPEALQKDLFFSFSSRLHYGISLKKVALGH